MNWQVTLVNDEGETIDEFYIYNKTYQEAVYELRDCPHAYVLEEAAGGSW